MSLRRYEKIRDMLDFIKFSNKYLKEHNVSTDIIKQHRDNIIRDVRKELKRIDIQYVDPLGKPMTEEWREHIDEDSESGYDYRILKVDNTDGWTDDEIEMFIMQEVGYPPICSPYDCTGKRFTRCVSFSRQPCGIVMIHSWGLDV